MTDTQKPDREDKSHQQESFEDYSDHDLIFYTAGVGMIHARHIMRSNFANATLTQWPGPRGHLLPMVIVGIGTGIRREDLFNLTWERIDFQRRLIDVPNSKTGRDYSVPMNENVKAVLRRYATRPAATVTFH